MIKKLAIGCVVLTLARGAQSATSPQLTQAHQVQHPSIRMNYVPEEITTQIADAAPKSQSGLGGKVFTYYVDSVNGKDANPGTLMAPWKSIEKVNATKLAPGKSVGFKRGGVWREALRPRESGLAGRPILFGAYGTGHQPVISGSQVVSGFLATRIAGVWYAKLSVNPHALWIDSRPLAPPVVAKADLVRPDQWFWDGGTLYINSKADPSQGHTIEAAKVAYPVDINRVSYITVDGLEVTNANSSDVELRDSMYDTIRNTTIHDSSGDGIYAGLGGGGHTVDNCDVYNTGLNRIFGHGSGIQFNGSEAPPVTIPSIAQNNYIHDIDNPSGGNHAIYEEVGGDIDRYNHFKGIHGSTAVKVDGAGVLIYGNIFDNIPAGGIWIDAYSYVKVYNNTFYNVGSVTPYAAVSFTGDGAESGVSVMNNIDYYPGASYSVFLNLNNDITGFSSDFNDAFGVWWAESIGNRAYDSLNSWVRATGQDANSISANPHFVGASTTPFRLLEASPATGRGVYIPGVTASRRPNMGAK